MRTLVSVASLAIAAGSSLAQGASFGVTGGVSLAAPVYSTGGSSGWERGGWTLGVSIQDHALTEALALRFDLIGSALDNVALPGSLALSPASYHTAGLSADAVWNVTPGSRTAAPYFLVGAGWYAVRTGWKVGCNPNDPGGNCGQAWSADRSTTIGTLGYNAGLGLRVSRFFVEARAMYLSDVPTQTNARATHLLTVPVTAGFWF